MLINSFVRLIFEKSLISFLFELNVLYVVFVCLKYFAIFLNHQNLERFFKPKHSA